MESIEMVGMQAVLLVVVEFWTTVARSKAVSLV